MLRRVTLILFLYMFAMACGGDASPSINDAPAMRQSDDAVTPGPALCVNSLSVNEALPERLSQTGLYKNIEIKEVNEALWAFEPEYQLWSDDAAKERWIYVPECESIDTSNMNDWSFPVGTRFFKEFVVDGQRIETRLIERIGDGAYDFLYGTYQWNDSETEATLVPPEGLKEAKGTTHDIPSESQCRQCHGSYEYRGGRPSRALGFSALLLNHDNAGVSLSDLVAQERLTHAPDSALQIPGTDPERDALGYLHVNCGCVTTTPEMAFHKLI